MLAALPQLHALKKKYDTGEITFPLGEQQQGLWMLAQTDDLASRAYNETASLELRGTLTCQRCGWSLELLIDRHEALRTRINPDGETQTVLPEADVELVFRDVSGAPDEAAALMRQTEDELFDLARPPVLRAVVLKRGEQNDLLLPVFHHVMSNGPLTGFSWRNWCRRTPRSGAARGYAWSGRCSLAICCVGGRNLDLTESEQYWLAQYREAPSGLELPDHPRPRVVTYRGGRESIAIDADLCQRLRHAGAEHRCSLFMTLFSAFNVLLHRLTGQEDVVAGASFESNVRELEGGAQLFANTTNVMPMRSRISGEASFADYLVETKHRIIEAVEHQEYFLGRLIKAINLPRDPARAPLFSALFNFETGEFRKQIEGLEIELLTENHPYRGPAGTAMYEIYMNVAERNGKLEVQCDYNADLHDAATV